MSMVSNHYPIPVLMHPYIKLFTFMFCKLSTFVKIIPKYSSIKEWTIQTILNITILWPYTLLVDLKLSPHACVLLDLRPLALSLIQPPRPPSFSFTLSVRWDRAWKVPLGTFFLLPEHTSVTVWVSKLSHDFRKNEMLIRTKTVSKTIYS